MKNLKQGRYHPVNTGKYLGNPNNIVYRSSWELQIFRWADGNPNILKWVSEEIVVPYWNPFDKSMHRYFPDLYMEINSLNGLRKCLVEIKPSEQSFLPPKKRYQRKRTYHANLGTYYKNAIKWYSAKEFCRKQGWEFILLCKDTETNRFNSRPELLEAACMDGEMVLKEGKIRT
jgi:hypothetical protein